MGSLVFPAEEVASDASIATSLMAHQSIGLKGILLFGNEAQKAKVCVWGGGGEARGHIHEAALYPRMVAFGAACAH